MDELGIIKTAVNSILTEEGLTVNRLILFGSRARGDAGPDSDWDLMVIVEEPITFPDIKRITGKIQLRLARKQIYNDIIIRNIEDYEEAKRYVGNISYYAAREGVTV